VKAEPLSHALGPGLGHRRVAQGTQGLRNPLKLPPALARYALKCARRAATNWK
jgi:hypothetical protein